MVLLVEDDEDLREAMAQVVTEAGYEVMQAGNGAEALALIQDGARPCVVILDLMMPIMDGREFVAHVADLNIRIPIVVVTAAKNCADVADYELVHKPFDAARVLTSIRRHCP